MRTFIKINRYKLFFLLLCLHISCNNNKSKISDTKNDLFIIKAIKVDETGWGYDIYKNNKLIIHQSNIPAIEGNITFKKEEDANCIAKIVVEKLKKNIFPPSITKEELELAIKNK